MRRADLVRRFRRISAALGVIARLAIVLLTAVVLSLAGCGGDDSGQSTESGSGTTTGEEGGATGATTTTGPGGAYGGRSSGGEAPRTNPDPSEEQAPQKTTRPEAQGGSRAAYTRKKPIPKERLKPFEQPIFEQSRALCRQVGIERLRRENRIESSDPAQVARGVAANTYLPESRDAVFSGCLAGLRGGD